MSNDNLKFHLPYDQEFWCNHKIELQGKQRKYYGIICHSESLRIFQKKGRLYHSNEKQEPNLF